MKDALLLQLQEVSRKIAAFEGKYNEGFGDFRKSWSQRKDMKKYSHDLESDYMDWEALELYKRELMRVIHSL